MGQPGRTVLEEMMKSADFRMGPTNGSRKRFCNTCIHSNETKNPCKGNLADGFLENTIRTNVCGLFRIAAAGGKRFSLTSAVIPYCYLRVALINSRDEFCDPRHKFFAWLDRNIQKVDKRFHIGNAKQFLGSAMMLDEMGVVHTTLTSYCPKSNRGADDMNRNLLDKVCSMLKENCMLLEF